MRTAGVGGVGVLAAGRRRPERIDADVFRPDVDVDLLGFRQHRDRRRRGVDAPARLGRRHPLHAVHAGFEFEPGEHALAGDIGDDFLVAAGLALAFREDLDLPAMQVGVALIHAEQIAGEQRRLVAAGAGADFEDGALLVRGVLGQEELGHHIAQLGDPPVEALGLFAGDLAHLGIGEQRLEVGAFASRRRAARSIALIDRLDLGPLAAEPDQRVAVERGRELCVDQLHAGDQGVDLFSWQHGSIVARRRQAPLPGNR